MFETFINFITSSFTLSLLAIAALMLLVLWILENFDDQNQLSNFTRDKFYFGLKWFVPAVGLAIVAYILLFLSNLLWGLITSIPDPGEDYSIFRYHVTLGLAAIAAIGAVFGFVFGVFRVWTTLRQTRTAESQRDHQELVLLNSRIQDALALLSARTTETRLGRTIFYKDAKGTQSLHQWQDAPEHVPTEATDIDAQAWQSFVQDVPDIQTRLSGIGRLQALIREHPSEHRSVNEHLAFFLRANSDAKTAQTFDLAEPDISGTAKEQLENITKYIDAVGEWSRKLKLQPDLQAAIALITSVDDEDTTKGLDLRNINLQGADLPSAHLKNIRLDGSHLQGANLSGAQMQGVNLNGAQMQVTNLREAQMQGAELFMAQMQGAVLSLAQMQGAFLLWAQMQGADLSGAQMNSKTNLKVANLAAAALHSMDYTNVDIDQEQINAAFGDASVILPEGIDRPAHWLNTKLRLFDFDKEWDLWKSDPTNYKPPQSRP